MKKVGRNDLCPCGSGKKYKNCCGKNNIISLELLLENELKELEADLINFSLDTYNVEMSDFLADRLEELVIPEESSEMFYFFTVSWFITSIHVNGKTILEHYINKNKSKWKRQRIKDILLTWKQAKPTVSIVADQDDNHLLTINDLFTNDIYKVKLLDHDYQVETGGIVIGIPLPIGEHFIFFTPFIDLPARSTGQLKKALFQSFEKSGESNPNQYLSLYYPEVLHLMLFGPDPDIEDLEWLSPKHLDVALVFKEYMEDFHDDVFIKLGVHLWYQYCSQKNPKIIKTGVYVAALIYLVDQFIPYGDYVTQGQLANVFGISSSSLSAKYRDMEKVLREEIADLEEKLESIDDELLDDHLFWDGPEIPSLHTNITMERELLKLETDLENNEFESIDEINDFLDKRIHKSNVPKKELTNKERAQDLLFDAYESLGDKRKELAEKALQLYPNSPDGYTILAEFEFNPLKKEQLLLTGMNIGLKELGLGFFAKNKGHFWGIVRTRPFMRAQYHYAVFLLESGRMEEAIKQFEELLELNPNDHQGVRYELFISYIESGVVDKAKNLLNLFNETTTAHGTYNNVLIEFLKNGATIKVKQLLQKAKAQNPFVPDYLLGNKNVPEFLPNEYGLGDESEAVIYADQHLHLWTRHPKLMELLRKTKY